MNPNINDAWEKLAEADSNERPKLFVEYCEANIHAKEMRELSEVEASANICGASQFIDDLKRDNPMLEDVIDMACNLELPPEHRDIEQDPSWDKLKELVQDSKTKRSVV